MQKPQWPVTKRPRLKQFTVGSWTCCRESLAPSWMSERALDTMRPGRPPRDMTSWLSSRQRRCEMQPSGFTLT